jgi:hypothetical protein
MQCRFKVYGDGQALAEHVDEVADQNDADAINRIMRITRVKALAAAPVWLRERRWQGTRHFLLTSSRIGNRSGSFFGPIPSNRSFRHKAG